MKKAGEPQPITLREVLIMQDVPKQIQDLAPPVQLLAEAYGDLQAQLDTLQHFEDASREGLDAIVAAAGNYLESPSSNPSSLAHLGSLLQEKNLQYRRLGVRGELTDAQKRAHRVVHDSVNAIGLLAVRHRKLLYAMEDAVESLATQVFESRGVERAEEAESRREEAAARPSADDLQPAPPIAAWADRVIVIEDVPGWQRLIIQDLRRLFPAATIDTAGSYLEGKALLDGVSRDDRTLIILDLGLPESPDSKGIDTSLGLRLLKQARGYGRNCRVAVLTTTRNLPLDQLEAFRLGVPTEDYIFKIPDRWQSELESSLRRLAAMTPSIATLRILRDGDWPSRGRVVADGMEFPLGGMPFLVLCALAERRTATASDISRYVDEVDGTILNEQAVAEQVYELRLAFHRELAGVGRYVEPFEIVQTLPGIESAAYRLGIPDVELRDEYAAEPSPPANGRRAPLRVLVVEDSPGWRRDILAALHFTRFQTAEAACVDDAVATAASFQPELLVLDLDMPVVPGGLSEMDAGLQALSRIRALGGVLADVPAVVLSSVAHVDDLRGRGLREVRPDDWLQKGEPDWDAFLLRSVLRLEAERERDVVFAASARTPYVLEMTNGKKASANISGASVPLTKAQARLLGILAERPYLQVGVETILERVYPDAAPVGEDRTNALRLLLRHFRVKLAKQVPGLDPKAFITNVGGGYMLQAKVLNR